MEQKVVRRDEQIHLIMEWRQSGLPDYQWCRLHDINPGTFYNRVSKLRKRGYTFPDSLSKSTGTAVTQEVVRMDLVKQEVSISAIEQNACPIPLSDNPAVVAELVAGNVTALAHCPVSPEFSIEYTVSNPEAAKNKLLGEAVKDSMSKAGVLAAAAGVTLGDIVNIDYSWGLYRDR